MFLNVLYIVEIYQLRFCKYFYMISWFDISFWFKHVELLDSYNLFARLIFINFDFCLACLYFWHHGVFIFASLANLILTFGQSYIVYNLLNFWK